VNEIEIVRLNPAAWPDYKALRLEALYTEPQAFGSTYADNLKHPDSFWQKRLESAVIGHDNWLLFARVQDRLVGMVGAFVQDGEHVVHIISMYVTPNFRGRGIARALMSAILSEISQNETLKTAQLTVNADQQAAIRVYERAGFRLLRTEKELMGDGHYYAVYIMEKWLE
jgi:ribosomal protein S18 acetylase RimI-like enzyme